MGSSCFGGHASVRLAHWICFGSFADVAVSVCVCVCVCVRVRACMQHDYMFTTNIKSYVMKRVEGKKSCGVCLL